MTRKNALTPEVRRELYALRRIAYWLSSVSPAGRRWLRDFLTADLERRPE